MAHLALYREWRPKTFDEVVEQKHAVYALRQSVISGQIAHAYLFSGTRGTGKTTMAKIFSRAINCLQPQNGNPCNECAICRSSLDGSLLDIVEMDAASNNSVDNIRRICDEVVYMPSQARYKVYIIDEVHMLSMGAFNALLKTLEEPPAHAVFILATTEPHRIPATILSRCQRYDFRRIPVESMALRLTEIAGADGIDITPEALQTIATLADGALRDAISLLDQARASVPGQIDRDQVLELAGVVQDDFLEQVATAMLNGQVPELLALIEQLVMAGRDLARFITDLAQHFRNILVCQVSSDPKLLVRVTSATLADMRQLAGTVSSTRLIDYIRGLSSLLSDLRWAADGRTVLEIGLIRLTGTFAAISGQQAAETVSETKIRIPFPAALKEPPTPAAPAAEIRQDEAMAAPAAPTAPAAPAGITDSSGSADEKVEGVPSDVLLAESAPNATIDTAALWGRMQASLLEAGHMTLYLFSRAARPMICGGTMQLFFDPEQIVNQQELGQPASQKHLREAAARAGYPDLVISTVLAAPDQNLECPVPAEDSWIQKVQNTAHSMGIPIKMEE